MNLELDDAIEYIDGEPSSRYGEVFLRGNNVLWIQIDSTFID
ncbi:MAG: LSM domain-containing protein [Candidatus Wukongarchaeota archaeon]